MSQIPCPLETSGFDGKQPALQLYRTVCRLRNPLTLCQLDAQARGGAGKPLLENWLFVSGLVVNPLEKKKTGGTLPSGAF